MISEESQGRHTGRNSVRKLIDTFSQGIEGQTNPEALGPLKGVRKCGVPILPGLGNVEAVLSTGVTSCRPQTPLSEKTDDLDLDSLPPPPWEVLMDNSYESVQNAPTEDADEAVTKVEKSPQFKRAALAQRLRASVQPVTVLPSKAIVPQPSKAAILAKAENKGQDWQSKAIPSNMQPDPHSGLEKRFSYQLPQRGKLICKPETSHPPSRSKTTPQSTCYKTESPSFVPLLSFQSTISTGLAKTENVVQAKQQRRHSLCPEEQQPAFTLLPGVFIPVRGPAAPGSTAPSSLDLLWGILSLTLLGKPWKVSPKFSRTSTLYQTQPLRSKTTTCTKATRPVCS
ncbi:unnamed protein product [Tetraodon nigroviridis]|uniref:(spotted green pufferfish) hypothetical protein n=1 Tax=Tetraodon nigroviridis TaxID=99883 RepID=Q4SK15_TETNG|nr:unnamed protein product [Tetraodon nigroviridis]